MIYMSIRAYLMKTEYKEIDGQTWHRHVHEYLWNNWQDHEIWDELMRYADDYTNNDCVGSIEIAIDKWEGLKRNYEEGDEDLRKVVDEYKDVFMRLDTEFKLGEDWVTIELY